MSRTFRRKHYETEVGVSTWNSKKVAGYYTEWDIYWADDPTDPKYQIRVEEHRKPTREEYYRKYWWIHGESKTAYSWSPGPDNRRNREIENRRLNKTELHKWLRNEEYEPLFEENPRSCGWDWT